MNNKGAAIAAMLKGLNIMTKDEFMELLHKNATVVADLLGVTNAAVYAWRRNGLPPYWWGAVHNLTDEQVSDAIKKADERKLANAQKRSNKK